MDAIILAAGRGSRMGARTAELPKCLTRFAGRTLLDWQLAALRRGGANRLGIVAGYQHEAFDPYCRRPESLVRFLNPDWAKTNMVMSLACAESWLNQGPCLVSYSDIFFSPQTAETLSSTTGDIAITFDPDWRALWTARFEDPLSDAETFRRGPHGELLEIGGRAESLDEIEGQYMGLLKFTPRGWEQVVACLRQLPNGERDRLSMTGLLRLLLATGTEIQAVPCRGSWGEIDSEADLFVYEALLRDGHLRLDWIAEAPPPHRQAG